MKQHNGMKGLTLLEVMLVLAIASGVMIMAINYGTRQAAQQRLDKTALQIQQILNAAQAYYLTHGQWPTGASGAPGGPGICNYDESFPVDTFVGSPIQTTYFSSGALNTNPFGWGFTMRCDAATGSIFLLTTALPTIADAQIVAGELPVAYVSDVWGTPLAGSAVTAQITVPGQNLNNARSVNFAGVYRHGACVPVPACPNYNPGLVASAPPGCIGGGTNCMTPQILVAPVSVTGLGNQTGAGAPAYPITSFTSFAIGPSTAPGACDAFGTSTTCPLGTSGSGVASPSGYYWRVCVQVLTQQGDVSSTTQAETGVNAWGQNTAIMAITRCAPPSEPIGSDFTVYTQ